MNKLTYITKLIAALREGGYHDFVLHRQAGSYIGRHGTDEALVEEITSQRASVSMSMTSTRGGTAVAYITAMPGEDEYVVEFGASSDAEMANVNNAIGAIK